MRKKNLLPLCISFSIGFFFLNVLGTWQINKNYTFKKNNTTFKESLKLPQKIFNLEEAITDLIYIKFEGLEIYDKTLYLEPRTYNGKIGYHEIAPYKLGNQYVLVNKGFTEGKYKSSSKKVNIEGIIIRIPKPKFFELKNDFINNKWYTLDRADFQKKMGLKLTPYIIYQQNISADNNRIAVKPNLISKINHLNYALTWFFLSLTLCVIFSIYYNRNY